MHSGSFFVVYSTSIIFFIGKNNKNEILLHFLKNYLKLNFKCDIFKWRKTSTQTKRYEIKFRRRT